MQGRGHAHSIGNDLVKATVHLIAGHVDALILRRESEVEGRGQEGQARGISIYLACPREQAREQPWGFWKTCDWWEFAGIYARVLTPLSQG